MCSTEICLACLIFLLLPFCTGQNVQYFVEEQRPSIKPHLHPLRKSDKVVSPYKSATSTTSNFKSKKYEAFSLNCPHVTDAANKDVKLEVTWTMNDTIWLKIENGHHTIANKLYSFAKKTVNGKSVLRVILNNGRYFFDYGEITGEFSMEIHPVSISEDTGVWQCHVTVYQQDNTYTLTSRSRVKIPRGHRHEVDESKKVLPTAESQIFMVERSQNEAMTRSTHGKTSSFTRNDGGFVHINRDESIKYNTVVFNRQLPFLRNRVMKHIPDYDGEVEDYPKSRIRSLPNSSLSYNSLLLLTVVFICWVLV